MELLEAILTRLFLLVTGIAPMLLFGIRLKHRKHFYWRLAAFIVLYALFDFCLSYIGYTSMTWLQCLFNILKFFVTGAIFWLMFDEKILTILFCCVSAKCAMHIAEYCTKIVFNFTVQSRLLSLCIYAVVYVAVYFLYARKIRSEECNYLNNFKIVLFSIIIITVTDVVVLYFNAAVEDKTINVYMFCFVTIICIIMLFLQYSLFIESKHLLEEALLKSLREKEREQFEISKETVNLIGIRQHDLMSMLQSRTGELTQAERDEIEKLFDGYELPFKTGNRTLDVILMEKYLVCKRKKIRLEVLADGSTMGFFSEMDLYSLFLNALNNAIESADKIEEEGKRVIWLKSYTRGSLLFIQVRNYYDKIVPAAGSFETTKEDKTNHGFGLRSMKMIVKKYGGEMSVRTENNMFILGIAIPLSEKDVRRD